MRLQGFDRFLWILREKLKYCFIPFKVHALLCTVQNSQNYVLFSLILLITSK